jgi:hypothetical protein
LEGILLYIRIKRMVWQVIVVLEQQIQEFDLGIERTKDKIIAKCRALVDIFDKSSIKIWDECLMAWWMSKTSRLVGELQWPFKDELEVNKKTMSE